MVHTPGGRGALVVAAAALCVGAGAWDAAWDEPGWVRGVDYTAVGDMEVETSRYYRGQAGAGVMSTRKLFPGGVVNYRIDPAAFGSSKGMADDDERIRGAIAQMEDKTCIRFKRCAAGACPSPLIVFKAGPVCASPVGVRSSGYNVIRLHPGCGVGTVVHEVLHSLGMAHEQSRNDRDTFITIAWGNIPRSMMHNFAKSGADGRDLGPYDYASIMHY